MDSGHYSKYTRRLDLKQQCTIEDSGAVRFAPNEFRVGLWAGSEGLPVTLYKGTGYTYFTANVVSIDLENRVIILDKHLEPGEYSLTATVIVEMETSSPRWG